MEAAGIDLLLIFHPVNIQYLIGSRAKCYQEFQVLFFTLEEARLSVLVRLAAEKGFLNRRIGLGVPEFYMHAYTYEAIRDLPGGALVAECSRPPAW